MAAHPDETGRSGWEIEFTDQGRDSLDQLACTARNRVLEKLTTIACSEFRSPWEWDFQAMDGPADGRLAVGDGLRIVLDIDRKRRIIRVHGVRRRENLYS